MLDKIIKPRAICAKNQSMELIENVKVNVHKVHSWLSIRLQLNYLGLVFALILSSSWGSTRGGLNPSVKPHQSLRKGNILSTSYSKPTLFQQCSYSLYTQQIKLIFKISLVLSDDYLSRLIFSSLFQATLSGKCSSSSNTHSICLWQPFIRY